MTGELRRSGKLGELKTIEVIAPNGGKGGVMVPADPSPHDPPPASLLP